MANVDTYLPYILKDVVAEVDNVFTADADDPFNVFFDNGLYANVTRSIYKKENAGLEDANIFPLIWLVSNSVSIQRGRRIDIYGVATFDLIIAMPTSNQYTSNERSELVFLPRLIPIYEELLNQISKSQLLGYPVKEKIEHRIDMREYWGGSESGQADTKNLFNNYIDAIHITGMTLNIKKQC